MISGLEIERQYRLQIQKSLATIDITLEALLKSQGNQSYPEEMRVELCSRLGEMLWSALPTSVTVLDLGTGVIQRDPAQIEDIPFDLRRTWNLQKVERYASTLAGQIGTSYTPKF